MQTVAVRARFGNPAAARLKARSSMPGQLASLRPVGALHPAPDRTRWPAGASGWVGAMKIIVIGATGTIGKAVVEALRPRHEVVTLSRSQGDHRADITDKASVERAFAAIGEVDAIVCCAGG